MSDEKEQSFNEWLVINSQLGDVSAFNTLLVTWQPRLLAYATRHLSDRELARDAVQEALLSISRSIVKLREIARILAIPAGTVKSRLYYARKTLATILENGND